MKKTDMFNTYDISRNACQLFGAQARQGYDWGGILSPDTTR